MRNLMDYFNCGPKCLNIFISRHAKTYEEQMKHDQNNCTHHVVLKNDSIRRMKRVCYYP